jgi:hypothetical protein
MKAKIIYIILSAILCASFAFAGAALVGEEGQGASGSCSVLYTQAGGGSSATIGSTDNTYYIGNVYSDSTTRTLCAVDVYFSADAGDISGKTFYIEVWTIGESTSLDEVIGFGTISGGDVVTGEFINVPISCTLSASTSYAITQSMHEIDESNYAYNKFNTRTETVWGRRAWDSDKASVVSNGGQAFGMRLSFQ